MQMHRFLARKALKRALKDSGFSPEELTRLLDKLPETMLPVPFPGYGNIVYDVPEDHEFAPIRAQFDAEADSYRAFFDQHLREFYYHPSLDHIKEKDPDTDGIYWANGFFSEGDCRTLYAFLAGLRPKRMIEVGCGNSTRIARKAIREFDLPTKITSIDPSPRRELISVTDEWIEKPIHEVDVSLFQTLNAGDIAFIDGSHVCHVGTDVVTIFLEILPLLKKGVYVHIHDIHLPWEYDKWKRPQYFNEHHLLAMMILNNPAWKTLYPSRYLVRQNILGEGMPIGSSFWIVKDRD
jgi:hypothetical protein